MNQKNSVIHAADQGDAEEDQRVARSEFLGCGSGFQRDQPAGRVGAACVMDCLRISGPTLFTLCQRVLRSPTPLSMFLCQRLVCQGFGQTVVLSAWSDTRGIRAPESSRGRGSPVGGPHERTSWHSQHAFSKRRASRRSSQHRV